MSPLEFLDSSVPLDSLCGTALILQRGDASILARPHVPAQGRRTGARTNSSVVPNQQGVVSNSPYFGRWQISFSGTRPQTEMHPTRKNFDSVY